MLVSELAFAVNFDVDGYTDSELIEIRNIIGLKLADSKKGDVLYEDDNISISYLGWKKEYSETSLWVTVFNKTDVNLMVAGRNTSINECSVDCSSAFTVLAGKRTNNYILSIYDWTLEEQWIEGIEYVEFEVVYYDDDDWDGLSVDVSKKFVIEYVEQ